MGMRAVWLAGISCGVAALAALAYACTQEEPVFAPSIATTAPRPGADVGGGEPAGSYSLPAPPDNVTATAQRSTGIFIPGGRVARVTVTGTLAFSPNPNFALCAGNPPEALPDGDHIGPAGFSSVPFPFRVFVGESDATHPAVSQILTEFGSPAAGAAIGYVQGFVGLGFLWAGRPSPWGFACGNPPVPEYLISGGQTITADLLPDPRFPRTRPRCRRATR